MPVVTLYHNRLHSLLGRRKSIREILEMLPYIGLDIEEQGKDYVKIEYNPNRPDFSTDYGIARALKGIFNIEVGLPKFQSGKSNVSVKVDRSVSSVRPYIVSLVAVNGRMDDEGIRQIITMQEDIHEGIGRKRKKVSIGIHNYDVIKPPLLYTTERPDFRFVPLNSSRSVSMQDILENTDVGKEYGWILEGHKKYPVIKDAVGNVLSFPPIINSEHTRVAEKTKNLLIDVTATDLKAAEDALAIIAITLYDAKFKIESVKINYGNRKLETPNMNAVARSIRQEYTNHLLGLNMSSGEITRYLQRSRLGASSKGGRIECRIPPYRLDIMHEVDLVEDVAVGYGINRISATFPSSTSVGAKDSTHKILDAAREVLVGLGMIEVMNFNLVSKEVQYEMMNRVGVNVLAVEQTKSIEHEVLRDALIPSLMLTLSRNIHEPYPQRIFEIGKTFFAGTSNIQEYWTVAVALAHKDTNYTEAKSYLQALLKTLFNIEPETRTASNVMLVDGKSAEIIAKNKNVGIVGEVSQHSIDNFKLRVPISVLEVNISKILES
ncbi:MAG TPA: phenylalanine--tRNA ligase subunit beta [Nitrososphaerales archaeon]|nr:phenylalanine--tRNA ligase subunit beta [Nitrososphaerales archaeon]